MAYIKGYKYVRTTRSSHIKSKIRQEEANRTLGADIAHNRTKSPSHPTLPTYHILQLYPFLTIILLTNLKSMLEEKDLDVMMGSRW